MPVAVQLSCAELLVSNATPRMMVEVDDSSNNVIRGGSVKYKCLSWFRIIGVFYVATRRICDEL